MVFIHFHLHVEFHKHYAQQVLCPFIHLDWIQWHILQVLQERRPFPWYICKKLKQCSFKSWCLSLLSSVMIKLQVRVLRLMKLHDYLNVPPCIICTPCIIWFRHSTSGIFGLWALRNYIQLCVSSVQDKEYALLKQNKCIFLYILVWNIFSDLYVTCGQLQLLTNWLIAESYTWQ